MKTKFSIALAGVAMLLVWNSLHTQAQYLPVIPLEPGKSPAESRAEWEERQKKLDATETSELIQLLGQPREPVQQIQQTLYNRGKGAVPGLIEAMKTRDGAAAAAQLLGRFREEAAIPALVEYSKRNKTTLIASARPLGMIGGPVAATHLIEGLIKAPAGSEQEFMQALADIGDNRAVEPIAAVLLDSRRPVRSRQEAIVALVRFSDPRARAALQKAMERDSDWRVYYDAKCALEKIHAVGQPAPYTTRDSAKSLIARLHKIPVPPEGIDAFIEKNSGDQKVFHDSDFLPQAKIDEAREELLALAKRDPVPIVEQLMLGFVWAKGDVPLATELIAEIGPAAYPALRIGVQRGDKELAKSCAALLPKQ